MRIRMNEASTSQKNKDSRNKDVMDRANKTLKEMEDALNTLLQCDLTDYEEKAAKYIYDKFKKICDLLTSKPQEFKPAINSLIDEVTDAKFRVFYNKTDYKKEFTNLTNPIKRYYVIFRNSPIYDTIEVNVKDMDPAQLVEYHTANCDNATAKFMEWCFVDKKLKLKYNRGERKAGDPWDPAWIGPCVKRFTKVKEYYDREGTDRFGHKMTDLTIDEFEDIEKDSRNSSEWKALNGKIDKNVGAGVADRLVEYWKKFWYKK